jgi:hypothetical protein
MYKLKIKAREIFLNIVYTNRLKFTTLFLCTILIVPGISISGKDIYMWFT